MGMLGRGFGASLVSKDTELCKPYGKASCLAGAGAEGAGETAWARDLTACECGGSRQEKQRVLESFPHKSQKAQKLMSEEV